MITIKTKGMTIEREMNDIISCIPAQGAVYFKFKDSVEVTIPIHLTQAEKAYLELVSTSQAAHTIVDLTGTTTLVSFQSK